MEKVCTYNEAEAIKLLIAGDARGLNAIYEHYAFAVARVGFRYLRSAELAEDLVQEVFSAVWVNREKFANVEFFQRYLFTMCRNHAIQHLKTYRRKELGMRDYVITKLKDEHAVENHVLDEECLVQMQKAVDNLPQSHKKVYKLVTEEGLSHREVAIQLDCSVQTVSNSMALVYKSIKQQLGQIIIILTSVLY
jgi:RNA polymerase sigma factor (sigma-70 family)